jgi:hypothetical protein
MVVITWDGRSSNRRFMYRKGFAVSVCILFSLIFTVVAQDKARIVEKALVVEIGNEASSELRAINAEFRAAQLEVENARLRYILAVAGTKTRLKLGDEYEFDSDAKSMTYGKFVLKQEPVKKAEVKK